MANKRIPPAVGEFAVGERDQLLARIAEQARVVPKPLHELRIAYQLMSAGQYDSGAPEHNQTIAIQQFMELLDFDDQEEAWETIRAYADMRAVDALFRAIELLAAAPSAGSQEQE